jgi:[ribosomal protein S18]-alanine N-acetyltransferase
MDQEPSIDIIPAEKTHIHEIADIEASSFAVPWPEEAFRDELEFPFSNFYIALHQTETEDQPSVTGYIIFWIIEDELQILNVAVSPNCRRQGIAQKLLDIAFKVGREKKVSVMFLEVRKSNIAALKLYEKNGFEMIGIRRNYYSNNNEDAIVMVWKP